MSAIVYDDGRVKQLDKGSDAPEQVTEEQAGDPARLARVLMDLLRGVSSLRRRWWPETVTHRDIAVDGTGTTVYRFAHNFGARVNWWPVDWTGAVAGPRLVRHSASDNNTLSLVSYTAGTLSLRIEEGG